MNVAISNSAKFLTYKQFRKLVDREVNAISGLGVDDLTDFDLWMYYDEDLELSDREWLELAKEAATDLLGEEGFPFE